ncbi:MAG: type IA DNA topoisomerase [Lachnospiraceae bacterium]|nr:type IA DNA topoisomerase [Lachnospiraceae bacterium]MDE6253378.1 type IA DNA topoisomerase [Lachnospiraceae bacterium]
MAKSLYIAEKPSVAQEFAKALKVNGRRGDGYIESENSIVTWCVGHLVTMSYPEAYDENLKRWSLNTIPFLPEKFKYEVIPSVKKQFEIVKSLLRREDVDTIYVCTDSGREGEYIYRLVEQMAGVKGKKRKRVWIDSQTEDEILRGVKEAKNLSEYDNLSDAAYLRAKEDYLMGINFSRALTLKYGNSISNYLGKDRTVISVGRVMTCVLGMIVRREREIREFVKTPFYKVTGTFAAADNNEETFDGEWKVCEGSHFAGSPYLYKENGFVNKEKAEELIELCSTDRPINVVVENVERKKEKKNPPLLFNLAELQNECSKLFKISPDETLKVVQELYEGKLVTYPRTDARVLSTAVAKEISKNISGLRNIPGLKAFAEEILSGDSWKKISSTRYVNDKQITDHYAIIPTGQGIGSLKKLSPVSIKVYEVICRRFLAVFYEPAVYQKYSVVVVKDNVKHMEKFTSSIKLLAKQGYLKIMDYSFIKKNKEQESNMSDILKKVKKGDTLICNDLAIKEGETTPPKRYNSGSIILAMENAGQLIEDEELRAQIKGSGIGTSATRAEILKKLVNIKYISLNKKTQVVTPTQMGEMIYEVVDSSIRQLLNPELTASWEKGLTYVAEGTITSDEYMKKLEGFVARRTQNVKIMQNQAHLRQRYDIVSDNYK